MHNFDADGYLSAIVNCRRPVKVMAWSFSGVVLLDRGTIQETISRRQTDFFGV